MDAAVPPPPSRNNEPPITELSLKGSRWTVDARGADRHLLTLAVAHDDHEPFMWIRRTVSPRGLVKEKIVPSPDCAPRKGQYVLLGDFWPLRFTPRGKDTLARVDAIVRVLAPRRGHRVQIQVVWAATNAVSSYRKELRSGTTFDVDLGHLAMWSYRFPIEQERAILKLAGINE